MSIRHAEVLELRSRGHLERVIAAVDVDLERHGQPLFVLAGLIEAHPII